MLTTRILIVEDELLTAEDIRLRVQQMGYSLAGVVDSGEDALKKVAETHPDLVLMDIQLGKSMDGITTAEEIREQFGIPVIYLTAYTDEETLQRAKITEPSGYIIKPFNDRTLHISIDVALYKHQAEKALARQQALLTELFDGVQEGIALIDECAAILLCNPAYAKMVGELFPDNLIDKNAFSFFEQEARSRLVTIMKNGHQGKAVTEELSLITRQGTCKEVRLTLNPRFDSEGNWVGDFVTMLDITDRKQAEQALRESEGKYRCLIENCIEGIAVVEGTAITFVNQALAEMFGAVQKADLEGRDFLQFVAPEYQTLMRERVMARERGENVPKRYKFKARRVDGSEFDAAIAAVRHIYRGKVFRQAIIRDLTQDKQAEKASHHATLARLYEELSVPAETIAQLSRNIHHTQHGPLTEQQRDMLATLEAHSQQLLETLTRLCDCQISD